MPGTRHHTVPRFLLKGFASQTRPGKAFTWLYRRGQQPREVSIADVGVSGHFYGRAGEKTADLEIRRRELEFAKRLDLWRRIDNGTQVPSLEAAQVVTHLSLRTKHFRESVAHAFEPFIKQICYELSKPASLAAVLRDDRAEDFMRELVMGNPESRAEAAGLLPFLKTQLLLGKEQGANDAAALLAPIITQLSEIVARAAKQGHVDALLKAPVPEVRMRQYRRLKWFICKCIDELILGDCACLFEAGRPRSFSAIDGRSGRPKFVYLPISSNRVLVGMSTDQTLAVCANLMNEATVTCSREFFVASRRCEKLTKLAISIGDDAERQTKEFLTTALSDKLVPRFKRAKPYQ